MDRLQQVQRLSLILTGWGFRSRSPVSGASNATGSYAEGDLNGQSIVIEEGTGGVFQVGPTDRAVNRIEVGIRDLRSTGDILNLDEVSMETQGSARQAYRRSIVR